MRPIDADALLDYLTVIPIDLGYREVEDIEEYVKKMPTIEERKTGWWVYEPGMYMCSECWDAWAEEQAEEVMSFNYCPNCGARKVRGEEHG